MSDNLHLILVDFEPELCAAWRKAFADLPRVTLVQGRFEDVAEYDCLVAAGNSFGLMDGGIDLAIARRFPKVPPRVSERIREEYLGELPVGTSVIVETGEAAHPCIACAPTMRVPMRVGRTDYAYVAFWAALCAVHRHNRDSTDARSIRTLACSGHSPAPDTRLLRTLYRDGADASRRGGASDGAGLAQFYRSARLLRLEDRDCPAG